LTAPLAALPWLPFFNRASTPARRVRFGGVRFLTTPKERARRSRRRVFLATTRSLALLALSFLWFGGDFQFETTSAALAPVALRSDPPRVLIVDGSDSGATRFSSNVSSPSTARLLELALNPFVTQDEEKNEKTGTSTLSSAEFSELRVDALEDYDVVILADLFALLDDESKKLDRFVEKEGRAVVVWAGGRTSPEDWNERWRRRGLALEAKDATFEGTPTSAANYTPTSEELAFAANFPDFESSNVSNLPISRAICCVGGDSTPILRDRASGAPIFSRLPRGRFWFASSPEPNFGGLASAPCFQTLVEKTLEFATSKLSTIKRDVVYDFSWLKRALHTLLTLAVGVEFFLKRRRTEPSRADF